MIEARLLSSMFEDAESITKEAYRLEALSCVGLGWARCGETERAAEQLERILIEVGALSADAPSASVARTLATLGRIASYTESADAALLFERCFVQLERAQRNANPRYSVDTFPVVARELAAASMSWSARRTLAHRALDVVFRSPLEEQSLLLAQSATTLRSLGVADAVIERAGMLITADTVRTQPLYLSQAVEAFVGACEGPVDRGLAGACLDCALPPSASSRKTTQYNMELIEAGVDGLGKLAPAALRRALAVADADVDSMLLRSALARALAACGAHDEAETQFEVLLDRIDHAAGSDGYVLLTLTRNASHLEPERAAQIAHRVLRLFEDGALELDRREQHGVLRAWARMFDRIEPNDQAFELLERSTGVFDRLAHEEPLGGASWMFSFVSDLAGRAIDYGDRRRGIPLVEWCVLAIARNLAQPRSCNPYFANEARLRCAFALVALGKHERGLALLEESLTGIEQECVHLFEDRVDLAPTVVSGLSLVSLEPGTCTDILLRLMESVLDAHDCCARSRAREEHSCKLFRRVMRVGEASTAEVIREWTGGG